jgi:hypothetical protein
MAKIIQNNIKGGGDVSEMHGSKFVCKKRALRSMSLITIFFVRSIESRT